MYLITAGETWCCNLASKYAQRFWYHILTSPPMNFRLPSFPSSCLTGHLSPANHLYFSNQPSRCGVSNKCSRKPGQSTGRSSDNREGKIDVTTSGLGQAWIVDVFMFSRTSPKNRQFKIPKVNQQKKQEWWRRLLSRSMFVAAKGPLILVSCFMFIV